MAEDRGPAAAEAQVNETSPPSQQQQQDKVLAWHSYLAKELPRTLQESTDSAFQSARFLQQNSSTHLRTLQDFIPQIRLQYKSYEDAFFKKVKGELMSARDHPAVAGGIFVMASLLLMRGPRRFLLRQTLGRLQSEEAQFVRAEKNVKEFNLSVDLMRKESRKLLERAALAERDMKHGHAELMNSGSEIQMLTKSLRKAEAEAVDVMDLLREISGREALKLRADVASMASFLRQQRTALDKKIMKLSELGVPV